MNNARRKRLDEAIELLNQAKEIIEDCASEEEEYRDNMPENLQSSEKYENADSACDNLNSAMDSIDEIISNIEEAQT